MEQTPRIRSTTILSVRRDEHIAIGGDGQVTMNEVVVKHHARKVRRLYNDRVLVGFAGSAADAFALMERFNAKLEQYQGSVLRSAHELARDWRTDRALRRLESLLIVVDKEHSLLLSGSGDVIEPDDGVLAIGSGGPMAAAAARALLLNTDFDARRIVDASLKIAADLCIYTNGQIWIEEL